MKYLDRMDNLLQRNRLLGFALLVMLLFNAMNWFAVFKAQSSSRVAIVPVVGGTGMWVGNGKASDEYLRSMARYITAQLGDYSAGTYRAQLEELLLLFPPESVGTVHADFMHLADEVDRYPSISSYIQFAGDNPLKVMDNLMQVHVRKNRLVNGSLAETVNTFYCIEYRIDDTQFRITKVDELSGDGDDQCINKRLAPGPGDVSSTPAVPAQK